MIIRLQSFSYRFAEQVLNSKLALKQEIEGILRDSSENLASLSRPNFNKLLDEKFTAKGWVLKNTLINLKLNILG